MATNIGVTVQEVDGRAAPVIAAAPTSTAGFLVRSERGAPDSAVHVRGFADFVTAFGSYQDSAFGAFAVRGFFENGGSDAYVVRVVGAGANAASIGLTDRAGTPVPTLDVRAGARGRPDPGAWGNALTVSVEDNPRGTATVPAQVTGSAAEPFALTDGGTAQFTVTTRGVAAATTVTFRAADFASIGAASAQEVAAAINRQTTAVRVSVAPSGRLVVAAVATDPRVWARLQVTAPSTLGLTGNSDAAIAGGSTAVALSSASGFRTGSAVRIATRGHILGAAAVSAVTDNSGVVVTVDGASSGQQIVLRSGDFASASAPTAAEAVAAINRQALAFTAELTSDNRIALLSNKVGAGSAIALAAPAGPVGDARGPLGFTGATAVAGTQAFRVATAASETYRLVGWAAAPALPAMPAAAALVSTVEFDLVVRRGGREVERFTSVSMSDTAENYVEAVLASSAYVTVTDLDSTSGPGLDLPAVGTFALAGGVDGADPADTAYLGDPSARTGLEAFNDVPIQLLGCPETTSAGVVSGALAYCERRGDAMYVGVVPRGFDLEGAKAYAAPFRGRKVYGALYGPWIQVVNPTDTTGAQPFAWIPPVGHILGTYARITDARGIWKAPAGDEARLAGALGVEYDMTDTDHTDLVRAGGVNGIRAVPGAGIVLDASRTLSTDTRWLYVNVRRLFNFVKSSLRDGLTWVAQEPHTEDLRRMVRFNVITPFLLGLWRQGAFGSDPAESVFTVKCDEENNPPADVSSGLFTVAVHFYPVKPAESILIVVGQQDSGASAAEA